MTRAPDALRPAHRRRPAALWAYLFMAIVVVAAYWPALGAEFVVWDDDRYLLNNPLFNPPQISNIPRQWAHPFYGMYIPVTYSIWTIVASAAWLGPNRGSTIGATTTGLNPYVFHGLNVAVHTLSAFLVYLLLARLVRHRPAALAGALVFALHPLTVESVAWVTGFRDVLGGCLGFASLYFFLKARGFEGGPARPWRAARWSYALATVFYILAVLSKATAVAVPFMAVAMDLLWYRRRDLRPLALLLLPWIGIAIAIMFVTRAAQIPLPAIEMTTWAQRPFIAADALAFYLWKFLLPTGLSVNHGRTPHWVLESGAALRMTAVTVAATIAILLAGRWWRPAWVAGGVFLAALLPVIGLIPNGYQIYSTVADRYAYPALLAAACVTAAGLARARGRVALVAFAAAGIVLVTLGVLTFRQAQTWRSTGALFSHTLDVNPGSWVACNNLAFILLNEVEGSNSADPQVRAALEAAGGYATRAIQLRPLNPEAEYSLGLVLARLGDPATARQHFIRSLRLHPFDAKGYATLAGTYAETGQLDQAIRFYEHALKLDPQQPQARRLLPALLAARARAAATRPASAPVSGPATGPSRG